MTSPVGGVYFSIPLDWTESLEWGALSFLKEVHSLSSLTSPEKLRQKMSLQVAVEDARQRADADIPFRMFAVQDLARRVRGLFSIRLDGEPHQLLISVLKHPTLANHSYCIEEKVTEWLLKTYLPSLYAKKIKRPVYFQGEADRLWGEKRVVQEVDLDQMTLVAAVDSAVNPEGQKLAEIEINSEIPEFFSTHRFNAMEIPLSQFL